MEPCSKSNWKHRYESLNTKNSRFKRNNISNILKDRWGSYVLLQFFFTWFSASESYRVLIIDITNILVSFVPFVGIIDICKLKKFQLLTPSGHEISLFEIWAKYIVTKICHFEFWLSLITSGLSKGPIKLKKLLSCLVSTMIFIKRRK